MEPITRSIDSSTVDGHKKRLKALESWSTFCLSAQCLELDEDPYESTWTHILDKYGNYYHP